MNIVKLKNRDENEFEHFLSWLEEDLDRVNRFILENLGTKHGFGDEYGERVCNDGSRERVLDAARNGGIVSAL